MGAVVAGFWLFMGIGHAIDGSEPFTAESAVMATLMSASVLGVLIAWRREGLGGAIVVACGVAHSTFALFAAGRNHVFAMLVSGGPFLLIGVLFLLAWRRSRPGA
jgi:hypothetical protein